MAEVTLVINGKNYGISCDEGQEQRVVDLSHYIDGKVKDMIKSGAATNENHALVLAALVIADEHFDVMDQATSTGSNVPTTGDSFAGSKEEAQIASAISTLAQRIDSVAEKMKAA